MKNIVRGIAIGVLLVSAASGWAHEGHGDVVNASQQTFRIGTLQFDPSLLGFSGLKQVFNVHPVFIHFPIALFPAALLLYSLGIVLKRRSWCVAGRAALYLAVAGTMISVVTGLMAEGTFPHNERIHHIMQTHKTIGLAIGLISLLLVPWSFLHKEQRPKGTFAFLFALLFINGLVLQNADLGGRMVFIEGAGVKAAFPAKMGEHPHEPVRHEHGTIEPTTPHHAEPIIPPHHDEPSVEQTPDSRDHDHDHNHDH